MSESDQSAALLDLQTIPGVGPAIARDLWELGYRSAASLAGENPGGMFWRLGVLRGGPIDRCVLYVFRCAVYYASNAEPDPELLQWWKWKDKQV